MILKVAGAENDDLLNAVGNEAFGDFEDAMQDCCAVQFRADYIITGNVTDFQGHSRIPAVTPKEFFESIAKAP